MNFALKGIAKIWKGETVETTNMGNEGSSLSSDGSGTPASSELMSVYSMQSSRGVLSSVTSTRVSSPVEPPEPDLSHLTEEEVAQIKSVINRAKHMQESDQDRVRDMQDDYASYAANIVRAASLSEIQNIGKTMCPVCHEMEVPEIKEGFPKDDNLCVDCEKRSCPKCGDFQLSSTTQRKEWVCCMCAKRRLLVMTSGMWYHGYQPDPDMMMDPTGEQLLEEIYLNGNDPRMQTYNGPNYREQCQQYISQYYPDNEASNALQAAYRQEVKSNEETKQHRRKHRGDEDDSVISDSRDHRPREAEGDDRKTKSRNVGPKAMGDAIRDIQRISDPTENVNAVQRDFETDSRVRDVPPKISGSKVKSKHEPGSECRSKNGETGPAAKERQRHRDEDRSHPPDQLSTQVELGNEETKEKKQPKKAKPVPNKKPDLPVGVNEVTDASLISTQEDPGNKETNEKRQPKKAKPVPKKKPDLPVGVNEVTDASLISSQEDSGNKETKEKRQPKKAKPVPKKKPDPLVGVQEANDASLISRDTLQKSGALVSSRTAIESVGSTDSENKIEKKEVKREKERKSKDKVATEDCNEGKDKQSRRTRDNIPTSKETCVESKRSVKELNTEKQPDKRQTEIDPKEQTFDKHIQIQGVQRKMKETPETVTRPENGGKRMRITTEEEIHKEMTHTVNQMHSFQDFYAQEPELSMLTCAQDMESSFVVVSRDGEIREGEKKKEKDTGNENKDNRSRVGGNGEPPPKPKRKHRPKSLNLSRLHGSTSSEEESSEGSKDEPGLISEQTTECLSSADDILFQECNIPEPRYESHLGSSDNFIDDSVVQSPTVPRSPSWREGLESPPFSPRRRDSYPGRRKSSPVSPKDKRLHFTYTDMSPPSRQLSISDLYGDSKEQSTSDGDNGAIHFAQKPSPISPDEMKNTIVTTMGQPFHFSMPSLDRMGNKEQTVVSHSVQDDKPPTKGPPTIIDLATYAATIASSTANLTSMSVSPTNLLDPRDDQEPLQISPTESQDTSSTESASSPTYDNMSESSDDVELADPSSKPIDYQGSKRQKAKPPATDWSPVIDLSPILDVSPSIEEAEQEDMLAKQREEQWRREAMDEEDEYYFVVGQTIANTEKQTVDGSLREGPLKRFDRIEDISKIGSPITSGISPRFECPPLVKASEVDLDTVINSSIGERILECTSMSPVVPSNTYITSSGFDHMIGQTTSKIPATISTTSLSSYTSGASDSLKFKEAVYVEQSISSPEKRTKIKSSSNPDLVVSTSSPTSKQIRAASDDAIKKSQESISIEVKVSPVQKQDSFEKRRAKDLKAKPDPLVLQHIESEEESKSPQYRVLESPPTPEAKTVKRDFSDSTSVSPTSSPDNDLYAFPSPVTPPDSDTSPPKPQSPSSPGSEMDDIETAPIETYTSVVRIPEEKPKQIKPAKLSPEPITIKIHDKISAFEKVSAEDDKKEKQRKTADREQKDAKDHKKVRRKLPPIPAGEEPVLTPKVKPKQAQSKHKNAAVRTKVEMRHKMYHSSTSDDSMNEDEQDANRWSTSYMKDKNSSNLRRPRAAPRVAVEPPKEAPVITITPEKNRVLARDKYLIDRNNKSSYEKSEADTIIDSLVEIYGLPISNAMRTLKKKLQDELRRATEGRRKKIEELEEIRTLQRQIGQLKLGTEFTSAHTADNRKTTPVSKRQSKSPNTSNGGTKRRDLSPQISITPRSSPQVHPRRSRHRRQASDPMISKFSPIKEDKDIEADFQAKSSEHQRPELRQSKSVPDDSSQSGISDNESIRSEPVTSSRFRKIRPSEYAELFISGKSSSAETLHMDRPNDIKSHSESTTDRGRKTVFSLEDDDEARMRQDRLRFLQDEIERRKKQLEETKSKSEYIKSEQMKSPDKEIFHSYENVSVKYARPIPTGIIKPLDDDIYDIGEAPPAYEDVASNYSSSEYLAHRQERLTDYEEVAPRAVFSDFYSDEILSPSSLRRKQGFSSQPSILWRKDPIITSSITLPELAKSKDFEHNHSRDNHSSYSGFSDADGSPASDYTPAMPLLDDVTAKSRKILHAIGSGSRPVSAEFNIPGGVEELMPQVHRVESDNSVDADEPIMKHMMEGGVTILKQIDRKKQPPPPKPVKYPHPIKRILLTTDPKDRSVKGNGIGMKIVGGKTLPGNKTTGAYVAAIYPGGVAGQLHGELKEGDQILEWNGISLTGKSYEEVQRVIANPNGEIELVVRPGACMSVKLLTVPTESQRPASAQSSYDNVEYYNSEDEYESCSGSQRGVDPKQLAAQLEGIRETFSPGVSPSSSQQEFMTPSMSSPSSTPRSDPTSTSSDRQRQTDEKPIRISNQMDSRAERTPPYHDRPTPRAKHRNRSSSPAVKYSSRACGQTQPTMQLGPAPKLNHQDTVPSRPEEAKLGEIQLQLSHDDFDNTLNLHVIQAKNLVPKDINGQSDPFVKIYLLPGREQENKRRTKHISSCLNPEWHQTVMFQDVARGELQQKILEITVWDYDRFKTNDFHGQVVLDLSDSLLFDNKPHWYVLCDKQDISSFELPKPTVPKRKLPPPEAFGNQRSEASCRASPATEFNGHPEKFSHGLGRRRTTLTPDRERHRAEAKAEISSTRSSPIPSSRSRHHSGHHSGHHRSRSKE